MPIVLVDLFWWQAVGFHVDAIDIRRQDTVLFGTLETVKRVWQVGQETDSPFEPRL